MYMQGKKKQRPRKNIVAGPAWPAFDWPEDEKLPFDGRYGLPITIVAPHTPAGVHMEYEYISQVLGKRGVNWERAGQALCKEDGKYYDLVTVELKNGEYRKFLFDITGWYGKWDDSPLGRTVRALEKLLGNRDTGDPDLPPEDS